VSAAGAAKHGDQRAVLKKLLDIVPTYEPMNDARS